MNKIKIDKLDFSCAKQLSRVAEKITIEDIREATHSLAKKKNNKKERWNNSRSWENYLENEDE